MLVVLSVELTSALLTVVATMFSNMLAERVTKNGLRQLVHQVKLLISLDRKFKRVRLKQKLGGLCLFQSTI